jgi:hypothetical protein
MFLVFICHLGIVNAQTNNVDQDPRIRKYKKEMIKYLSPNYPGLKIGDSIGHSSDGAQVVIKKSLELFSDSLNEDILLVSFGILSSDTDPFWGVLTNEGHYFFYDADDLNELELRAFMNKYDRESVETVIFYCNKFPTLKFGGIPLSISKFNERLFLVKKYLDKNEDVKLNEVNAAVSFLQKLTGIKPQFNANPMLQPNLTKQDYTNWLDWVRKNDSKLYWDADKHEVTLK